MSEFFKAVYVVSEVSPVNSVQDSPIPLNFCFHELNFSEQSAYYYTLKLLSTRNGAM
jgi:hypothetical protein